MLDWQCLLRWGLVGILLFIGQRENHRRPSHRFGGKTMRNTCLSLESSYIPVKTRRKVLTRDDYKCVWCGKPENKRLMHLIQKQYGGETLPCDLVVSCEYHQRMRGSKILSEFISDLVLEKIDVFQEMGMVELEVTKKDGTVIRGLVDSRPSTDFKGFWITYDGNGEQELILREEVKGIKVLSGQEKK